MAKKLNQRLEKAELRKFAFSFALGMSILTTVGYFKQWETQFLLIPFCLAIIHLTFGLLKFYLGIVPMFSFTRLVGKTISFFSISVILTLVYYLLFTPMAFLVRAFKKDHITNIPHGWLAVQDNENDPDNLNKLF